ncbi:hypothetical protein SAMN03003324_02216 [Pedobacter antarcticus]|uniref:Uncharacterized protein n=1 Tax=Pedobacter antarcticus TaxID=34086 RepID=A0A1I2FIL8_9SPHI|nr:hypothetical protein SAMN03003324_02216 [Pedobacter antarcticus]
MTTVITEFPKKEHSSIELEDIFQKPTGNSPITLLKNWNLKGICKIMLN